VSDERRSPRVFVLKFIFSRSHFVLIYSELEDLSLALQYGGPPPRVSPIASRNQGVRSSPTSIRNTPMVDGWPRAQQTAPTTRNKIAWTTHPSDMSIEHKSKNPTPHVILIHIRLALPPSTSIDWSTRVSSSNSTPTWPSTTYEDISPTTHLTCRTEQKRTEQTRIYPQIKTKLVGSRPPGRRPHKTNCAVLLSPCPGKPNHKPIFWMNPTYLQFSCRATLLYAYQGKNEKLLLLQLKDPKANYGVQAAAIAAGAQQ